jgi:hypothetical protein
MVDSIRDWNSRPGPFRIPSEIIIILLIPFSQRASLLLEWKCWVLPHLDHLFWGLQKGQSTCIWYLRDNMFIHTSRTQSSNGSLSNSVPNLLSTRCPLPAVPSVPQECRIFGDLMLSQEVRGSSQTRRGTAKSKEDSSERRTENKQCPKCSFVFSRARDLKRHFRLHTGEKPYGCKACGETFMRSDTRGRHWVAKPYCFAIHGISEELEPPR